MELLRRALLIGCMLPGLWLLRLAPLDPLLTLVPVDFAARQKQEAASVPDDQKTEAQRRAAQLPLSVYVEEVLQYNVFPATGPQWDRVLGGIDALVRLGDGNAELRGRVSSGPAEPGVSTVFVHFGPEEEPVREVLDKLAAGGGTTYVSISRPGGDHHYRVDRRRWTSQDFGVGSGFRGTLVPPAAFLYPFRWLGAGSILAGLVLFVLLPGVNRAASGAGLTRFESAALVVSILLFIGPLIAVGGSVQALTRGFLLTLPCWALAAVAVHLFAGPGRNAPDPLVAESSAAYSDELRAAVADGQETGLFVREGLAFLAIAIGPLVFLMSASMILWNR